MAGATKVLGNRPSWCHSVYNTPHIHCKGSKPCLCGEKWAHDHQSSLAIQPS